MKGGVSVLTFQCWAEGRMKGFQGALLSCALPFVALSHVCVHLFSFNARSGNVYNYLKVSSSVSKGNSEEKVVRF